jgi:hypothetical protein
MNLNFLAGGVAAAVNPQMRVKVQVSTGWTLSPNGDGSRIPSYAPPVYVFGQIQPVTWRDIQHLDGLNLQGTRRVIYLNGRIEGLVRPTNQGGDLITLPDKSVWLVTLIIEGWSPTAGWTKAAIQLQNGS